MNTYNAKCCYIGRDEPTTTIYLREVPGGTPGEAKFETQMRLENMGISSANFGISLTADKPTRPVISAPANIIDL